MMDYDSIESGARQYDGSMNSRLLGSEKSRARALLTGLVSGRSARDVTCESRVKSCPSTG
jgi:hypothetical protein